MCPPTRKLESRASCWPSGSACSYRPARRRRSSRLNAEIDKALAEPSIRDNLLKAAQEPVGGAAAQFDKLFRDDYDKYARLVKELNIHVD